MICVCSLLSSRVRRFFLRRLVLLFLSLSLTPAESLKSPFDELFESFSFICFIFEPEKTTNKLNMNTSKKERTTHTITHPITETHKSVRAGQINVRPTNAVSPTQQSSRALIKTRYRIEIVSRVTPPRSEYDNGLISTGQHRNTT